ncbi:hypothetical protein [Mailhella massiliensis]|uniref:hypothetical protein n=1 Tax=Mailhella massiliensis TaxID=1903261 RepID=UPI00138FF8AC|nr:hypothetical protein [Mailhella massiliensis]
MESVLAKGEKRAFFRKRSIEEKKKMGNGGERRLLGRVFLDSCGIFGEGVSIVFLEEPCLKKTP